MTTGWRTTTLGEIEVESNGVIQTGPFGSQLHMSDYSPVGTPVVMPTNIKELRIDPSNIARVDDGHVKRLARHKLRPGDIVYSRRGDVEKCALIRDDESGWLCGTGCLLVRVGGTGVDTRFLAYSLSQPETRAWISMRAVGATMPNLNTGILREVPVALPPIEEQRGIAATLGALDDKVESNRRQLHLLDQLFQSRWAEVSSQATGRERLGDKVSTQYGLTASAESGSVGPKFLRVTDINKLNWLSWDAIPTAQVEPADMDKYRLHRGDLVVARMADPGKSAIYDDESVEAVFASYLVRLKPRSWTESLYIYGFLKSPAYADYAAGAMTGSVQKNMNAKVIVDVDMPFPGQDGLEAFAAIAEPIRGAINQKERENSRLTHLRDALLPALLSGRMRVPEAEQAMAEVSA